MVTMSPLQHRAYWLVKKPVGHGTSWLQTSVRSLRELHNLGPQALGSVNHVETYTSVCNLYIRIEFVSLDLEIILMTFITIISKLQCHVAMHARTVISFESLCSLWQEDVSSPLLTFGWISWFPASEVPSRNSQSKALDCHK